MHLDKQCAREVKKAICHKSQSHTSQIGSRESDSISLKMHESTKQSSAALCVFCCKHQFSHQSSVRANFHVKWLFQLCASACVRYTMLLQHPVPPALVCLISLLWDGGITLGISRILAAPIDGTVMTVPIM